MAQFIAATIPLSEGSENPLMQDASSVAMDLEEREALKERNEESPPVSHEPAAGSYERFIQVFGSGGARPS